MSYENNQVCRECVIRHHITWSMLEDEYRATYGESYQPRWDNLLRQFREYDIHNLDERFSDITPKGFG